MAECFQAFEIVASVDENKALAMIRSPGKLGEAWGDWPTYEP